jgi:hypothetical protein
MNHSGKIMSDHGNLFYGLLVGVDIENFTKLDTLGQSLAQTALSEALDLAAHRALLDRGAWVCQPRGDGELAILPAGTDVAWVISEFAARVIEALAELRDSAPTSPPIRLRMAMHHGPLTTGRFGAVGHAPIATCRLLDAPVVRRVLAAETSCSMVLVVSERLYEEVVRTRFYGLAPERFQRIRVAAKGTSYTAYVCTETPVTQTA